MKLSKYLLLPLILFLTSTAFPQKLDKPMTEWSKEDVIKFLTDSPWAKPYQSTAGASASDATAIRREQGQSVNRGGSDPRSVSRDFGPPPVTARLHSGIPLRAAMVRFRQYSVDYDKMGKSDQEAFDKSQKTYLDCAICNEYYVVTLNKAVDKTGNLVEEGILQGFTLDQMKGNVFLTTDNGDKREIFQFNAPSGPGKDAVLYFKRLDDAGKPLITQDTKEFHLSFNPAFLDSKNRFTPFLPRNYDFKVQKLVVGGKIMF